jgi:NTE family protein
MNYPFRNLVFEGGGVKGIAYVGALHVLEERQILARVERVGGTSAGAINALLLGLGYSLGETEKILKELDFRSFLDECWGVIRDSRRLVREFGWYKGDFFRSWAAGLVGEKLGNPEATFLEASKKSGVRELYFMGTNLSTRFSEVFSLEHTPRMCIADAVRISMSIPLFFAAKRGLRGDVYVDGGVLDNYPVKLFDRRKYVAPEENYRVPGYYRAHNERLVRAGREISPYVYNRETLGFRLDSAEEIAVFRDQAEPEHRKIDDFFAYAWALVETLLGCQESRHLHEDDWHRTVYIDTLGVGTTDFDLPNEKKEALRGSGAECTRSYFVWYDDPANEVLNRAAAGN